MESETPQTPSYSPSPKFLMDNDLLFFSENFMQDTFTFAYINMSFVNAFIVSKQTLLVLERRKKRTPKEKEKSNTEGEYVPATSVAMMTYIDHQSPRRQVQHFKKVSRPSSIRDNLCHLFNQYVFN